MADDVLRCTRQSHVHRSTSSHISQEAKSYRKSCNFQQPNCCFVAIVGLWPFRMRKTQKWLINCNVKCGDRHKLTFARGASARSASMLFQIIGQASMLPETKWSAPASPALLLQGVLFLLTTCTIIIKESGLHRQDLFYKALFIGCTSVPSVFRLAFSFAYPRASVRAWQVRAHVVGVGSSG